MLFLELASLAMPVRGKRVSSTAKTIIFNVCSYFEWQRLKSKAKGLPTLMDNTMKAIGFCERTVTRVVAEKRASDGATFVLLLSGISMIGR